ncbi:MAG: hypothetical protein OZ924_10525 [Burkholderiaceae bacterium]|nr:hypothetical protein [Burkholderiaceae bacterium]
MFAQNPASGNPLPFRLVGIIIPYTGIDDEPLVNFAGLKLAERFGLAAGTYDALSETVLVYSLTPELTDLDMTILMGIGIQVAQGREGVAVVIDDDLIMM